MTESEFNEFESRRKFPQDRFQLSANCGLIILKNRIQF